MAAPTHLHGETFSHEKGGSSVLRSRFIRALNLFPETIGGDGSGLEAPVLSVGHTGFENRGDDPFTRDESASAPCQEMLAMDGINLPEFESLDALPSTFVDREETAGATDELSNDPDQLWFDETVTTMFMEDADKPQIETSLVEPQMETRAWPLGVIAEGIDPAFTGFVENDENAETEIETAVQLEAEDEVPSAPTPDTFLITAKDEVVVESANEAAPIPIKPRPRADVPAPAQDLPFAAMLGSIPAGDSGKRGFGVKLAPGWKPLRGQKVSPPSTTIAASSGADADTNHDAASDAGQELVEATLRTPRQDSILDGFGEFLEEQVVLSAAIDEPDFKALASSFENREAASSSSDTEWQPTSSTVVPDAVSPEPPSATAPRVRTEWISGPPTGGEGSKAEVPWLTDGSSDDPEAEPNRDFGVGGDDSNTEIATFEAGENFADKTKSGDESSAISSFNAENVDDKDSAAEPAIAEPEVFMPASASDALPKSSHPISAPSLVTDDQPRGFSASLLYGAEPAGSFFDDLEDGSASGGGEDVEKADDPQPMIEDVARVSNSDSVFPKAVEATDGELELDGYLEPEAEPAELKTPWSASKLQEGFETGAVAEPEMPVEVSEQHDAEVAEAEESVPVVAPQSEPVSLPAVDEIPVSALGYAHSQTNPALIRHGVACPSCGVKLQIQARYLNIEGKCPGCSEMIVARQRMGVEPIAELATGRFPNFERQPDLGPSEVPGGTVLSEGVADEKVAKKPDTPLTQIDEPATPLFDPFSNPNHALKKVREAAAGGVWGPTSGKGLS